MAQAHPVVLVLARCALGAAAAVSVPAALRMLSEVCADQASRRRALATWSAAGAAAGASGFLLGGLLTDLAGWRSLFWVNVPITRALLVGVHRLRHLSPAPAPVPLDLRGAVPLTTGVAGLVVGASLLEHPDRRALAAAALVSGVVLLVVFARAQRRVSAPLLPTPALRDRRLRTGAYVAFANTATTSSVTIASLYLQQERGLAAAATGAALLPFSLCVVAGSVLAAPLQRHVGLPHAAATGLLVISAQTPRSWPSTCPRGRSRRQLPAPASASGCPKSLGPPSPPPWHRTCKAPLLALSTPPLSWGPPWAPRR